MTQLASAAELDGGHQPSHAGAGRGAAPQLLIEERSLQFILTKIARWVTRL